LKKGLASGDLSFDPFPKRDVMNLRETMQEVFLWTLNIHIVSYFVRQMSWFLKSPTVAWIGLASLQAKL
jgi:hypothetical protein